MSRPRPRLVRCKQYDQSVIDCLCCWERTGRGREWSLRFGGARLYMARERRTATALKRLARRRQRRVERSFRQGGRPWTAAKEDRWIRRHPTFAEIRYMPPPIVLHPC